MIRFKDDRLEAGYKTVLSLKKPGVQTSHTDIVVRSLEFSFRNASSFRSRELWDIRSSIKEVSKRVPSNSKEA